MGSRIVCCFVLYSAFDSRIMQLAIVGYLEVIQFDGLSATLQNEIDPCFWCATSASRALYIQWRCQCGCRMMAD